ncbi:MAG: ABC transporter ATP-binding protein [Endozoicomonas sp. (ex Botrylloides leachii)]|nr:ABC transporter ATP-binding protein [Endozoicomonas sp. (ex Botrylloides leachii)]
MLNFVGKRSVIIVLFAGLTGLLLAIMEIVLSAYIVKLLSLIGIGQTGSGFLQSLLGAVDDPQFILIGFFAVTMMRSLLHIAKGYCAVSANELFVTRLRLVCISSTLGKIGRRHNASSVYSLISDVFIKSALTFYGLAHSVPLIVQGLLLFIFLMNISTYLSFVGLTFVFIAGAFVFIMQRQISAIVRPLSAINDSLYQSLKRILDNLLLIRFCKLEKAENDHVVGLLVNYLKRVRKSNLLALISENIPSLLGSIVIAVLFYMQLRAPDISPELFLAFTYIFIRFVQCLSQLVNFSSLAVINLPYFMTARAYYHELPQNEIEGFDACLTGGKVSNVVQANIDSTTDETERRLDLPPYIESVELSYGYEVDSTVIKALSFTIPSGAQCVIVGPSGVGKSTLLNLLTGEIQPVSGSVRISGLSPTGFLDSYSQESAYAGPEPLLFEGTVRDNLLYGVRRSVSDMEITAVLKSLGLGNWLTQFEGDFSLPLGADGVGTSSGQSQRLSIARAILRRPKLLILDEVTANLDFASEQRVLDILETLKGKTTVIIVTHSPTMMKNADITINLGLETESRVRGEL